jgi:hypothetical protein
LNQNALNKKKVLKEENKNVNGSNPKSCNLTNYEVRRIYLSNFLDLDLQQTLQHPKREKLVQMGCKQTSKAQKKRATKADL